MADKYFFDKRVIKKSLKKYAVLFAIAFVILVPLNAFVLIDNLSQGMGLFITVVLGLAIVLLGDYLIHLYNKKKGVNTKEQNNDKK